MITVNIIANGAELSLTQPTVANGSAGVAEARFTTDSLWRGLVLTAVFRTPAGDILMPLENGTCKIPFEATECCGEVYIGLFGTDGEKTVTSVFCPFLVSPGTPTCGESAKNYTPSLYEQFSARFAKIENLTVTAESGDKVSVVKTDSGNGRNLHFTIPKGEKYVLTDEDKQDVMEKTGTMFYYSDGIKRDCPLFGGILDFANEEELEAFKATADDSFGEDSVFCANYNILCLIAGVPSEIWLGYSGEFVDFMLPAKVMQELKGYVDEAILGGAW